MRFSLSNYRGLGLVLLTAIVALWLAATSQLDLYIHPRYILFTAGLSAIAVVMVLFGGKYAGVPDDARIDALSDSPSGALSRDNPDDKTNAHPDVNSGGIRYDQDAKGLHGGGTAGKRALRLLRLSRIFRTFRTHRTWPARLRWLAAAAVCIFGSLALLVSKPVPLTSATATQRGINAAASPAATARQPVSSPLFASDDYSNFTIKDWTSLLAQTDDPDFFTGKNVAVTGFVLADKNDKAVFYVSRFVVTCCAVDARPIGLPVYAPGWQSGFKQDDWVRVTGAFVSNPSVLNPDPIAVQPDKLQKTSQPENVYDY